MEPVDTRRFFEGVACPHCDAMVIPAFQERDSATDDVAPTPACEHVFLIAHDMGIAYLSEAARAALDDVGVAVVGDDGLLELDGGDDMDDIWALLSRGITWPAAQVLAVYAPAPSFSGTYVGVAPVGLGDAD